MQTYCKDKVNSVTGKGPQREPTSRLFLILNSPGGTSSFYGEHLASESLLWLLVVFNGVLKRVEMKVVWLLVFFRNFAVKWGL